MADGILDYLENNWSQILGMGGPTVPPAPPPAQNQGPQFSPSGVLDTNALTGSPVGVPGAPPAAPTFNDPMSGLSMPGSAGIPSAPSSPVAGIPGIATPANAATGPGIPGPTGPTPVGTSLMVTPNNVGYGGGSPINIGQATPPAPPGGPAPPTATTGSLGGALGLPPNYEGATATPANPYANGAFGNPPAQPGQLPNMQNARANMLTNFRAGLGKGLTNVGNVRPGTPAAGAFAAGAGGGLTGGLAQANAQQQQLLQMKNTLFYQSSTAFRDMLAAQQADNQEAYRKAQAQYLQARSTSIGLGGTGTNAWQNTQYGKTIQVENEAQKYEKGQQIILQKRWQMNGTTPDEQQNDLDRLQTNVEAYRQRLYKQAGVDPNQAEKLKTMGTTSDNPFDTKGMTLNQFNSQVPMGAWFTDQNGVVRQRTVPPPGGQSPSAEAMPTTADYMAMNEQPTGAIQ